MKGFNVETVDIQQPENSISCVPVSETSYKSRS